VSFVAGGELFGRLNCRGMLCIPFFSFSSSFSSSYIRKERKDGGCGNQIGIGLPVLELDKARVELSICLSIFESAAN